MEISLDSIDVERRPSGSGSRRNCRAKPVTLAAADATTGSLSKRFFGLHGLAVARSAGSVRQVVHRLNAPLALGAEASLGAEFQSALRGS